MCVPMYTDREIRGLIYADRISLKRRFSNEDLEVLTLLANIAAIKIENAEAEGKTAALAKQVANLGWKRALVIDGATVNEGFLKASRNIEGLDILPSMGANVYDILKRDTLVITKAGVEALEARLK